MTFRLNGYVLILVLAAGAVGMCRSEEPSTPGLLKRADAKRLMKTAQTREEFAQLATYFDERSMEFEQKATADDQELYRLYNTTFRAKNFPILVDHARNSGDYDRSEAKKCAQESLLFRQKLAAMAPSQAPLAGEQHE